ncbi:LytR/AlgR family response regulator transcription factor [Dyadobacter crusticola]|uniref:LytR/AlgR family response regulator transcription factor n=1 Tax=Dyadobacter crusticola TaxID=292407 RepID=UPI0004E21C12|nr:LytTR family DNA-binding domain-containing protein [Dyadobacter crusticola]
MKAVIIEDEALVARQLERKITLLADDIEIAAILPSLKTARKWFLENAEPDLIFMDVQLSDGISLDIFDFYALKCPIIFTTAYSEYAIRAFKVNSIDYLLKPVMERDLKKALDKFRENTRVNPVLPLNLDQLVKMLANPEMQQSAFKEKFLVSVRHQWVPVDTKDIACFYRDNFNYLQTFAGERYLLDYNSLDDIEVLLDPKQFYRANRQFIINMHAVQSISPHENQKLSVRLKSPLNTELDISREKAPAFKRWFDR